ncbi:MAG: hypothetical protein ABR502_02270 [Chitinophagaceae bacterium]
MPDLLQVFSKWWRVVIGFTLITTALAVLIIFLQRKQYLSTVTALPSNSLTSDKSRLFNENIQHLYSTLGTTDELDRFEGTARLDTLYEAVAKQLFLEKYYNLESVYAVIKKLRKNTKIERSPYGELKIKAWDTNPSMAAGIANALFEHLQSIHQSLQNQNNTILVQKLKSNFDSLSREYSSGTASGLSYQTNNNSIDSTRSIDKLSNVQINPVKMQVLKEQLYQQQKLISEYSLAIAANPPSLLVVEKARPSHKADRPKKLQWLSVIFFATLVFGLLLSFLLERRN